MNKMVTINGVNINVDDLKVQLENAGYDVSITPKPKPMLDTISQYLNCYEKLGGCNTRHFCMDLIHTDVNNFGENVFTLSVVDKDNNVTINIPGLYSGRNNYLDNIVEFIKKRVVK